MPTFIFSLLLFLTLPLVAHSRPIAQEELERINAFIFTQCGPFCEGLSGGFSSGEENEAGEVSSLEMSLTLGKAAQSSKLLVGLRVNEEVKVQIGAHFPYQITPLSVQSLVDFMLNVHDKIAAEKHYQINTSYCLDNSAKRAVKCSLSPAAGSLEGESLRTANLSVDSDLFLQVFNVQLGATLIAETDLVKKAQTLLNKIFSDLRQSKNPKSEDLEELALALGAVMEKIGYLFPVLSQKIRLEHISNFFSHLGSTL